ncbi:MAG: DUF1186 family protein [Cocleimonas sp.]|nr:DUF1186 family protein [Cocleimonas sp.]
MSSESLFEQIKSISQPPSEDIFTAIQAEKESITPLLIKEVEAFANDPHSVKNRGDDYIRHVVSLFLLANFRETKAYPHIIKLISLSGDTVVSLTGEVFTEALGRILASVYDGDLAPIKSVIENTNVNVWVRSAALESLVVLWKEDVIERTIIIDYLKELMEGKLERIPSYIWDNIGLIAYDVHPNGMENLLRIAINDKLIAPLVMDLKLLDDCIKTDIKSVLALKNKVIKGYIDSPKEELTWWLYPNENKKTLDKGIDYANVDVPIVDKEITPGERSAPMGWRSSTFTRATPKMGRNDPCHCGSGKKFKKCCGKV